MEEWCQNFTRTVRANHREAALTTPTTPVSLLKIMKTIIEPFRKPPS
jgi:hypothetical protein